MVLLQRDASTGVLSSATTVQLTKMADTVNGTIAGLSSSSIAMEKIYVSMASSGGDGGLMVLDIFCGPTTPAPTPAPGEVQPKHVKYAIPTLVTLVHATPERVVLARRDKIGPQESKLPPKHGG